MLIDIVTPTGSTSARPRRSAAEHVDARRGVVGDRVGEGDVPVGDAAVDDLQRGDGVLDGAADLGGVQRAVGEVRAEDEGDLRLCLGLEQPGERDDRALVVGHVVEEHAEVGLVDAELPLDRLRGRADLAADDAGAAARPAPRSGPAGRGRPAATSSRPMRSRTGAHGTPEKCAATSRSTAAAIRSGATAVVGAATGPPGTWYWLVLNGSAPGRRGGRRPPSPPRPAEPSAASRSAIR